MKKRLMRSVLAWFLILIVTVSPSISVFAAESKGSEPVYCCSMRIVSTTGSSLSSIIGIGGHVYLIFKNLSSSPITVGHMSVAAGDGISVGLFGNRSSHYGVWYNIEASHQTTGISLETLLLTTELASINTMFNSEDYYNTLSHNCAHFAVNLWNSVVGLSYTLYGGSPAAVCTAISGKSGATYSFSIPYKTSSDIAYHTSSGITPCPAGYNAH